MNYQVAGWRERRAAKNRSRRTSGTALTRLIPTYAVSGLGAAQSSLPLRQVCCESVCLRAVAAPVDVGQRKAEAERQCLEVYRRCRSSASIVGGAVSAEADCRGEQAACERERLARCKPTGAAEAAGCEQEHREGLRACGQ